jgi:hypothetical protein
VSVNDKAKHELRREHLSSFTVINTEDAPEAIKRHRSVGEVTEALVSLGEGQSMHFEEAPKTNNLYATARRYGFSIKTYRTVDGGLVVTKKNIE